MKTFRNTLAILALGGVLLAASGAPANTVTQQTDLTPDPNQPVDWSAAVTGAASDPGLVPPFEQPEKNFARAAIEVFGINALVWSFNRFIREGGTNPGFRIGFDSWGENLTEGWNWDDNNFNTNQISHPYHGNLYFNSARSSGYSFWESVPFTFAGSFMWEFFGEVHNPAFNDWIATSVGGTFLGEVTHRFATTIRDNTARGSSRNWREVGAMLVDPVGGLNRIIDGDWARVQQNPSYRMPKNYRSMLDIGLRQRAEDRLFRTDTTDVYVELDFRYGDPFFGDLGKPFDSFDFQLQLNFGDKTKVGRAEGAGTLAGMFLKETDSASHIIGAFHHYDYINTNAMEFGGQSITAGLLSRFETANGLEMRTNLQLGPMLLGGVSSDYASVSGRDYDFGPGLSARFGATFGRDGWEYFAFSHEQTWIHTVSGVESDHHVSFMRLRFSAPVKYNLGVTAEYLLSLRETTYVDLPNVSKRDPQLRLALSWILN